MHPALSIVFFTTASGAGFSLFLLLGLGGPLALLPSGSGFGFAALALAGLLATGGLASFGVPPRPARTSLARLLAMAVILWLSREGVFRS